MIDRARDSDRRRSRVDVHCIGAARS